MLLEFFPLGKSPLKPSGNGTRVLRGMACGSLENLGEAEGDTSVFHPHTCQLREEKEAGAEHVLNGNSAC